MKSDGSSAPVVLTAQNQAWDTQPRVLKDGNLVYLAMDRPTFEADRFHVVVRDNSGVGVLVGSMAGRANATITASHVDGNDVGVRAIDGARVELYDSDASHNVTAGVSAELGAAGGSVTAGAAGRTGVHGGGGRRRLLPARLRRQWHHDDG